MPINGPFATFEQVEKHQDYHDSMVIWTKSGNIYQYIMIGTDDAKKIRRLEYLKQKACFPGCLPVPIKMENFGFLACALRCILTESVCFHPDIESMVRWLNTTD